MYFFDDFDPNWIPGDLPWTYCSPRTGEPVRAPLSSIRILSQWLWQGLALDMLRIEQADAQRTPEDAANLGLTHVQERQSLLGPGFREEISHIIDAVSAQPEDIMRHRWTVDGRPRLMFERTPFRRLVCLTIRWFQMVADGSSQIQLGKQSDGSPNLSFSWPIHQAADPNVSDFFKAALSVLALGKFHLDFDQTENQIVQISSKPAVQPFSVILAEPKAHWSALDWLLEFAPVGWVKVAAGKDYHRYLSNQGPSVILCREAVPSLANGPLFFEVPSHFQTGLFAQMKALSRLLEPS